MDFWTLSSENINLFFQLLTCRRAATITQRLIITVRCFLILTLLTTLYLRMYRLLRERSRLLLRMCLSLIIRRLIVLCRYLRRKICWRKSRDRRCGRYRLRLSRSSCRRSSRKFRKGSLRLQGSCLRRLKRILNGPIGFRIC